MVEAMFRIDDGRCNRPVHLRAADHAGEIGDQRGVVLKRTVGPIGRDISMSIEIDSAAQFSSRVDHDELRMVSQRRDLARRQRKPVRRAVDEDDIEALEIDGGTEWPRVFLAAEDLDLYRGFLPLRCAQQLHCADGFLSFEHEGDAHRAAAFAKARQSEKGESQKQVSYLHCRRSFFCRAPPVGVATFSGT